MRDCYSLYIHIPFCAKKCEYCHFFVLPNKEELKDQLLEGLRLELRNQLPLIQGKSLVSIYFGGGTPFLFGPSRMQEFLKLVPEIPQHTEITLEANPESISFDEMKAYADIGITRVSIGLQSLDDQLLTLLTREHDSKRAIEAVHITEKVGISNISVDLMFDIPGQTMNHWENTLKQVIELPIKHLSLYNLTFEPHTAFYKKKLQLQKMLPQEHVSTEMYLMAETYLERAGLERYEISAYSKNGFQSRHNTGYWTGRPFLGLGPSAFSYWEGRRFRNVAHLNKYCNALKSGATPQDFEEKLETQAQLKELLAIRLRLKEGCDLVDFQKQHGSFKNETLADIKRLIDEGFLIQEANQIGLTQKGILFYDTVASTII